jgi:hypothetical protein
MSAVIKYVFWPKLIGKSTWPITEVFVLSANSTLFIFVSYFGNFISSMRLSPAPPITHMDAPESSKEFTFRPKISTCKNNLSSPGWCDSLSVPVWPAAASECRSVALITPILCLTRSSLIRRTWRCHSRPLLLHWWRACPFVCVQEGLPLPRFLVCDNFHYS